MNPLEERFLDSLLHETYHPRDVEQLLRSALAECDRSTSASVKAITPVADPQPVQRRWYSAIITMVAACIVIGLLAIWPSETVATELLHDLVTSAEAEVDREYRIETTGTLKLEGRLWVQGGDRFVLRLPSLLAGNDQYIWLGCTGNDFWFAPAVGPVFVSRQADWLLNQLQRRMNIPLPILHLSTVTRRLETRYTPPQLVTDSDGRQRLVLEQKSQVSPALPTKVEIIAHARVIHQLFCLWKPLPLSQDPLTLKLTLQQQTAMPADWYEHTAHHAAGRRVLPAQEGSSP